MKNGEKIIFYKFLLPYSYIGIIVVFVVLECYFVNPLMSKHRLLSEYMTLNMNIVFINPQIAFSIDHRGVFFFMHLIPSFIYQHLLYYV